MTTDVAAASDADGLHDVSPTHTDEYLLESFHMRDRDHSGSLSRAEFVGGANGELRQRQTELFVTADRNGDGLLTAFEYREKLLALSMAARACEDRSK